MATRALPDSSSFELEALNLAFSYLANSIDASALLPAAMSRQLITKWQRSELASELDPYRRAEVFLGHLQRAVKRNYTKFHTFVQLLHDTGQATIAWQLHDELTYTTRSMQATTTMGNTAGLPPHVVVVPDELIMELTDLRVAFAKLLRNYERELLNSSEAQDEMVAFLPRLLRNGRNNSNLDFKSSFDKLVEEKVSPFNIHYLKGIRSIFPEDVRAATRKLVDQYEQQRQHFMTGTTVNQFKKLFPASATPYKLSAEKVPVELKLQSEWDSDTIDDLTKLVNLFGVAGNNLLVHKVQESCIIGEEPMWKYSQPKQGTGEEAQQPEQLEEQDLADEVLKVHEQLLLTFKEIEKEMESLGNTFAITFESYTLEARGQLPKIQEKIKQMVLSEEAETEEHDSMGQLTAAEKKEVQQPEQLKEQGQADEVLKVNYEQLQLTMKEIEKEMESLGNAFTSESYTPEARDKLAKIQEKMKYMYLKQVVLSERAKTVEHGSTGQLTATKSTEKAAQQPEQLKEQGQQADEVLKVNREQLEREMESLGNIFTLESATLDARDKLDKIQEKIKHLKQLVLPEGPETKERGSTGQLTADAIIDAYDVSLRASKTALEAAQHEAAISKQECAEMENKINEMEKKLAVLRDNIEQQADQLETLQRKAADTKLAVEVEVQVDTLSDVIQDYKERLQASEEDKQHLLQVLELKQKMERARDAQISHLKTTQEFQEKYYNESLKTSKAEKLHLLKVLEQRQKMERARDAQISNLKTSNGVLQKKCDELIADDDDKQQLLNYMVQVCRPRDWQISLLEDRLTKRQLAFSSSSRYYSQKRVDNVLNAVKSWPTVSTSNTVVQADYLAIAPDFLRGVEVYGETVLEVVGDELPQRLEWPGYGFYIEVPQGALAPGVTASVGVRAILAGQFKLPENRQLISAIYWIHTSEVFLEEVAVNIRHCADLKSEEQCSKCNFVIAKCSQKELPYTFKEKEGLFNPNTQYGTIKVKRFSLVGETAPLDQELHYIGYMLYKPFRNHTTDFHFVVVLDDHLHLSEMKKHYQEWYKDATTIDIKFESSAVELKPQEHEAWKIAPVASPSVIAKSAVRYFQPGKTTWIPHCAFEIQPLSGDPGRLFCTVDLTGVESPKSFCIRYPQPEDHKLPVQTPPSARSSSIASATYMGRSNSTSSTQNLLSSPLPISLTSDEKSMSASSSSTAETTAKDGSEGTASKHSSQSQAPNSPTTMSSKPITTTLVHAASPTSLLSTPTHPLDTKPKMATLNCFKYKDTEGKIQRIYIAEKIAAKWKRLGLALDFETSCLNSIQSTCNHDVEQCCEMMLTQWLDGYVKQLPITWRTLLEALRDTHMNQLADELTDLLDNKHLNEGF